MKLDHDATTRRRKTRALTRNRKTEGIQNPMVYSGNFRTVFDFQCDAMDSIFYYSQRDREILWSVYDMGGLDIYALHDPLHSVYFSRKLPLR